MCVCGGGLVVVVEVLQLWKITLWGRTVLPILTKFAWSAVSLKERSPPSSRRSITPPKQSTRAALAILACWSSAETGTVEGSAVVIPCVSCARQAVPSSCAFCWAVLSRTACTIHNSRSAMAFSLTTAAVHDATLRRHVSGFPCVFV